MHSWYLFLLISILAYYILMWSYGRRLTIIEMLYAVQVAIYTGYFHQMNFALVLAGFEYFIYFYLFIIKKGSFKKNALVFTTTPILFYSCVHLIDSAFVTTHEYNVNVILFALLIIRMISMLNLKDQNDLISAPINFSIVTLILSRFSLYDEVTGIYVWPLISLVIFYLLYTHWKDNAKINYYFFIGILWSMFLMSNSMVRLFYFMPTIIIYLFMIDRIKSALSIVSYVLFLVLLFFIGGTFWSTLEIFASYNISGPVYSFLLWPVIIVWLLKKLQMASNQFEQRSSSWFMDWRLIIITCCYVVVSIGGMYGS